MDTTDRSSAKPIDCSHDRYWRGIYGNCMACRAEKAETFKAYVHKRLDDAGVPVDPPSPHREHGCRIGGRLDWLFGRLDNATQALRQVNLARATPSLAPEGIDTWEDVANARERDLAEAKRQRDVAQAALVQIRDRLYGHRDHPATLILWIAATVDAAFAASVSGGPLPRAGAPPLPERLDDNRCACCGWPLDPAGKMCRRGDCSMRPLPHRHYDAGRYLREKATTQADAKAIPSAAAQPPPPEGNDSPAVIAYRVATERGASHTAATNAAKQAAYDEAFERMKRERDDAERSRDAAQAEAARLREAWIDARQVVFAAREVVAAWPADMEFGKPGTSIGKLRDVVTAYDQRNHDAAQPAGGEGEG